jgi:hypothetical protein
MRGRPVQPTLRTLLATSLLVVFAASGVMAADRDGDGLRDGFERRYGLTSPAKADTDGDGVVDSAEDNDGDRLGNLGEQRFGTNPKRRDTDGDGTGDGAEDHDGDGRRNALQQDQRPVPANLRPSLHEALRDKAPVTRGCYTRRGSSRLVRCRFGPPGSANRIVVLGDSHALLLLDPLRRAARSQGWRLISMVKAACVPIPGAMGSSEHKLDGGRSCRAWRRKAVDTIRGNPPDLVIITAMAQYKFVDDRGQQLSGTKRPALWRKGLDKLMDRLPRSTDVLVIGDVPRNRVNPARCLMRYPHDLSKCQTARRLPEQRHVEVAQRAVVAKHGQHFGTLHPKICSYDPCPVIQGTAPVWRDWSHLSATFARRLTPSLRKIVRRTLANPATSRP